MRLPLLPSRLVSRWKCIIVARSKSPILSHPLHPHLPPCHSYPTTVSLCPTPSPLNPPRTHSIASWLFLLGPGLLLLVEAQSTPEEKLLGNLNSPPSLARLWLAGFGGKIKDLYLHTYRTGMSRSRGGIGQINIPLLSDVTKQIAKDYGVLLEDQGIALR